MRPLSSRLVQYTPPHRQEPPWVFHLKPPSVMERAEFLADLAEANCTIVDVGDVREALREGVAKCIVLEQQAECLQIIERVETAVNNKEKPTEEDLENLARLEETVREADEFPKYARVIRQRTRFLTVMPTLAVKRFLRGWEGVPEPFEKGLDGNPTDKCLMALNQMDINAIGNHIFVRLFIPNADEIKNSDLPPQS